MYQTAREDGDVTALLEEVRQGEPGAIDRLTLAIYDELHKIARSKMRRERNGHLLQTTALLNEAIARLLDGKVLARAPNRRYLFAAASNAMRIVLVNHARLRRQSKVATIEEPNFLDEILAEVESDGVTIEDLHRALEELGRIDQRQLRVVDMRFFGGFTVMQTAEELDVSRSTVENDFRIARAWLRAKLDRLI